MTFGLIKIISEGYPSFSFKIDELDKNPTRGRDFA
jgi:hypothetical protein